MAIVDLSAVPPPLRASDLHAVYGAKSYDTFVFLRNVYDFPETIDDPRALASLMSALYRPEFVVGQESYENFSIELARHLKEVRAMVTLAPTGVLLAQTERWGRGSIRAFHHKYGMKPNTWYFKEAYLKGFFHFERGGFSGWSEAIGNRPVYARRKDDETYVAELARKYLDAGLSKYKQDEQPFQAPEGGYLLLALQTDNDSVQLHRFGNSYWDQVTEIVRFCESQGLTLVVKRHPMCQSNGFQTFKDSCVDLAHVHFTGASLYQLLPGARAVITMNSGVGFEALLLGKPLFVFGKSDYMNLATPLKDAADLQQLVDMHPHSDDQKLLTNTGLARLLRRYQVHAGEGASFYRVICRMIALKAITDLGETDPYTLG